MFGQSGTIPEKALISKWRQISLYSILSVKYNLIITTSKATFQDSERQNINIRTRGMKWHVLYIPAVHVTWRILKVKTLLLLQEVSWFSLWLLGYKQSRDTDLWLLLSLLYYQGWDASWWRSFHSRRWFVWLWCPILRLSFRIHAYVSHYKVRHKEVITPLYLCKISKFVP